MRGTVTMKDDLGASYHIRVSGTPEDEHQAILNALGVKNVLKSTVSKIDTL